MQNEDFLEILKSRLHALLSRTISRRVGMFPGGQPVSFTSPHLHILTSKPFLVCEKSDGVRFLLLFADTASDNNGSEPVVFLIDRNWRVWGFEGMRCPGDAGPDTLLDGELVRDRNGNYAYLIFDILLYAGQDVTANRLHRRLQFINNHVVNTTNNSSSAFFPIALKRFYKPYGIQELLDRIIPGQAHANDGLIFTPVDEAYQSGSWQSLLKWKPAELNSVDFKLAPDGLTLLVSYGPSNEVGDRAHEPFSRSENEALARLDTPHPDLVNQILECTLRDFESNTWMFQRVRTDKTVANDRQVTRNILRSIMDRVEKDELIRKLPEIRRKYKEWEAAGLVPK